MLSFILSWLPLLAAILVAKFTIKRKRVAIPLVLLTYLAVTIVLIIILHIYPAFTEMMKNGVGDPQLLAGEISESIVTGILRAIIDIPIAILAFFGIRKWRKGRS